MKKLWGIVAVLCLLAACLCWGLASAENDVLYVANPKPEDRLHLRKEANISSGSLGKYYNGVQVEALEFRRDGWVRVKLDDTMGYMRSEYLSAVPVASAMPLAEIPCSGAKLWSQMNENCRYTMLDGYTNVLVMGFTSSWCRVYVPGHEATGWLHITLEKLVDEKATVKSLAWVLNPNPADRLNLRTAPKESANSEGKYYNGVRVEILKLADSNGWVKVRIGECAMGYMRKEYLSGYTVETVCPIVKINQSNVQLRTGAQATANVIETMPKDMGVTVLAVCGDWYHVQQENLDGYIPVSATDTRLPR